MVSVLNHRDICSQSWIYFWTDFFSEAQTQNNCEAQNLWPHMQQRFSGIGVMHIFSSHLSSPNLSGYEQRLMAKMGHSWMCLPFEKLWKETFHSTAVFIQLERWYVYNLLSCVVLAIFFFLIIFVEFFFTGSGNLRFVLGEAMNLGKLSGLKGLVSHSSGKRRFKGDLTPDMISPPLGDFRHTMHVGRGGDVFGDTSFLSNHGGAGNNADGDSSSTSEKNEGFFSRTFRHVRKTPDRPRGGSKDLSPPPPPVSPIIKNAISLPRLDVDSPNGCPVKVLFPSSPKTPENSTCLYGESVNVHTQNQIQIQKWIP